MSDLIHRRARWRRAPLWALGLCLCAGRAAAEPEAPAAQSADAASRQAPSSATGAPTDANARVEQARDAFVLGTTFANEGEWPEALNAFSRSSVLRAHPVTTYDMAYCERAMGHYTRARKLFQQSLSEHEQGANGNLPEDLLALAKSYLPEVERRLAHAFVRAELNGATVSVDGRPLERTSAPAEPRLVLVAGTRDDRGSEAPPASSFELLIDPGRHLIVLSRPGAPDKVITETFDAGTERNLLLRAEAPPPSSEKKAHGASPTPPSDNMTWTYVAYGVGGAGLLTGSVFGILALVQANSLSDKCDAQKMCDPHYQADLDSANRNAVIADIGFGVAIVGAAVGTYLLFSGKHDDANDKSTRSANLSPWVGPGMLGARGEF